MNISHHNGSASENKVSILRPKDPDTDLGQLSPRPADDSSDVAIEVIDSIELAKRLNVPESWVRSRSNGNRTRDPIPHYRLGRYVRYPWGSQELREWLDRQLVSANRAGHREGGK